MVIVKLIGGLGSQMSQYSLAKFLDLKGYKVKLDISAFDSYIRDYDLDKFNIDLEISSDKENDFFKKNNFIIRLMNFFLGKNISSKILNKVHIGIYNNKLIKEKNLLFDEKFLNIPEYSYLIGDFKSEKYFINIRSILINQFTLKHKSSNYFKEMKEKIIRKKNTCFIHIRRGDFANDKNVNKIHGLCTKEYYLKATKIIKTKINDVHFFLFSNDLSWCRNNIKMKNITYMENDGRHSPNEDVLLMSMCDHSIIDHSAFCWWGAWLNQNLNPIVIAPKRWFSDDYFQNQSEDIYCKNWIKI